MRWMSLLPRRGRRSTAISKGIILRRGEIYFEVPDTGVGTGAGKIVMGDGSTAYEDLPYFTEGGAGKGAVRSVNGIGPDVSGNVILSTVPYADNLLSPDNIEQKSSFIFRSSGGEADINTGEANLNKIFGNSEVVAGNIKVATPTIFVSTGANQFNKDSMTIYNYTVSAEGDVIYSPGSYICYIHAVGGLANGYVAYEPNDTIARIGWYNTIPTTSTHGIYVTADGEYVTAITNDTSLSMINNVHDGYIIVACTVISDLNVHPRWSGTMDENITEYYESTITIPTKDINNNDLPLVEHGFPAVEDVRDEIDFDRQLYTQRIGYYPYSSINLETVEALDVPYIYDTNHIYYVLPTPVVVKLDTSISYKYEVNDFGTEEFLGTTVPVYVNTVYGQNLRDKLRRDVVTISAQTLTEAQKTQVRTNIGVSSKDEVDQIALNVSNLSLTKADKVEGAISGDIATLNSAGNLVDSGVKASKVTDHDDYFISLFNYYNSKNILPWPYYETLPKIDNGVTFSLVGQTVNVDGQLFTGDNASLKLADKLHLDPDNYFVSGNRVLGTNVLAQNRLFIQVDVFNDGDATHLPDSTVYDYGDGVYLPLASLPLAVINVYIKAMENNDFDNVLVCPMIRLAKSTDTTYVEYAKTNRQLTNDLANKTLVSLTDVNISSPTDTQALVYDEASGKWVNATAIPSIATVDSVGTVKPDGDTITIDTDGTIHGASAPYIAQATAPTDTRPFWIDTANGGVLKYWNGSAWRAVRSVWD